MAMMIHLRLEGGTLEEEGTSFSLALFKPERLGAPRLADDMLGRNGELV